MTDANPKSEPSPDSGSVPPTRSDEIEAVDAFASRSEKQTWGIEPKPAEG